MEFNELEIVATIRNSKKLSNRKKQDILKRLQRIYESTAEQNRCNFMDHSELSSVFAWSKTKDGLTYWGEIYSVLIDKPEKDVILIDREELIDQISDYLWDNSVDEELFEVSNILFETDYNPGTHSTVD